MTNDATEVWKAIPGYEGRYDVSNLGRVYSRVSGKTLAAGPDSRGYPLVMLTPGRKYRRVHTLVLEAFVGPAVGRVVRHKNPPVSDVRLSNLEYGTQSENVQDRNRHGTFLRGEKVPSAKLSPVQVSAIRADTRTQREIAADYGLTQSAISRVKTKANWSHV